jgi:hypothetical protein
MFVVKTHQDSKLQVTIRWTYSNHFISLEVVAMTICHWDERVAKKTIMIF